MRTDEELLQQMGAGDPAAFDALYARHERRVFGFILSYVPCQEAAEDILQEVFWRLVAAAKAEAAGDAAPVSVAAWLYTVARNLCRNQHRWQKLRPDAPQASTTLASSAPSAEDELLARGRASALADAVGALPEGLATVYQLRAAGQSYETIAATLAIPVGTVRSRIHTLVRRLKKELRLWTV